MAFPGQRFVLNLDDGDEPAPVIDHGEIDDEGHDDLPSSALIGGIHERAPSAAAVAPPKPPSGSGFPLHKKRLQRSSFKQRRAQQQQQQQQQQQPGSGSVATDEKQSIDEENRHQLASMSGAQIQHEREELMSSMDPGLLERFLRRARIDDSQVEPEPQPQPEPQSTASTKPGKSVSFDVPEPEPEPGPPKPAKESSRQGPSRSAPANDDLPPPDLPDDLHPASELPSFHFPTPPQPPSNDPVPSLDLTSPSFLSDLQTHYFPNTPHDPSSLTWLQQPSADPFDPDADPDPSRASPYSPTSTAEAIHPAAIRFSLLGTILAPDTALSLPTTLGLHHHGNDPQAAGYTIPEITILGRSSFPAQRCVAWQVLGRILYRLGRGEFGDRGSVLVEGLWEVVEKEGVVGVMLVEAEGASSQKQDAKQDAASAGGTTVKGAGIGRHASAAAWAVEGVWLWQKGGGGDRGVLKEGVIRPR